MKYLKDIPKEDLKDKVVLLRAGLNLPLDEAGDIVDDFRIKAALPTIEYLMDNAKQVIIIAHKGRARTDSLSKVASELKKYLPELNFNQWSESLSNHKLILMENLRQDPREVADDDDVRKAFAKDIIEITQADIFIQDAFSTCHRSHTSIVTLPKLLPSYVGLLLEQEIIKLSEALDPPRPALFILGGAKFATKEPLIRKFLKVYDKIFIGGAIANEFFKAKGYEVGLSLVHDGKVPEDILYNDKIILPETVRAADSDGHTIQVSPKDVTPNMRIVDAPPPSDLLSNPVMKFILWNGPLGYYESGFVQGTDTLLKMFDRSDAQTFTGGGDTLATIGQERRSEFTHISSGGGAMLSFLQDGTLIGIKALG